MGRTDAGRFNRRSLARGVVGSVGGVSMAVAGDRWESPCGRMILHCGRWQEQLAYVTECDACITDPPYSERTHLGHDAAVGMVNAGTWSRSSGKKDRRRQRSEIVYSRMDRESITCFVDAWARRNCGWFAVFSDSVLTEPYRETFESPGIGLTGFHPLPCVVPGMSVRLCGDGPSSWATYLNVARPKNLSKWGTLRGAYHGGQGERAHIGGKPMWLMRQIVCDYSRPGDLIADPFAGSGTTLLAAAIEGRRAIGAECDPNTYDLAVKRLSKGYTPRLIPDALPKPHQGDLGL